MKKEYVIYAILLVCIAMVYYYVSSAPKTKEVAQPKQTPQPQPTQNPQSQPAQGNVSNVLPVSQNNRQLNVGSKGDDVRELQTLLNSFNSLLIANAMQGFTPLSTDGVYGAKTKAAHDLLLQKSPATTDRSLSAAKAKLYGASQTSNSLIPNTFFSSPYNVQASPIGNFWDWFWTWG